MPRSGYSALHGVNPNLKKLKIVLKSIVIETYTKTGFRSSNLFSL